MATGDEGSTVSRQARRQFERESAKHARSAHGRRGSAERAAMDAYLGKIGPRITIWGQSIARFTTIAERRPEENEFASWVADLGAEVDLWRRLPATMPTTAPERARHLHAMVVAWGRSSVALGDTMAAALTAAVDQSTVTPAIQALQREVSGLQAQLERISQEIVRLKRGAAADE